MCKVADVSESNTYRVPGMHCEHCERAIRSEIAALPGVAEVQVDLQTKLVTVRGERLDDDAVRAAINEAGYEVAASAS